VYRHALERLVKVIEPACRMTSHNKIYRLCTNFQTFVIKFGNDGDFVIDFMRGNWVLVEDLCRCIIPLLPAYSQSHPC